jgi:hypothetical protein
LLVVAELIQAAAVRAVYWLVRLVLQLELFMQLLLALAAQVAQVPRQAGQILLFLPL